MKRDFRDYIRNIIDAMDKAISFVQGYVLRRVCPR